MEKIQYEFSFEETVAAVESIARNWFAGPRHRTPAVDEIPDPVYFKNSNSMIVCANRAYEDFFHKGRSTIGRLATSYLDSSTSRISQQSDAMIMAGIAELRFTHECIGPNGDWYQLQTYKRSLLEYHDGAYEILGISRPVQWEKAGSRCTESLLDHHTAFLRLDEKCKMVCKLTAEGQSLKEIASVLDVSVKTVENRRRRVLQQFQLENAIEIVKMMVRFEERGFEIE